MWLSVTKALGLGVLAHSAAAAVVAQQPLHAPLATDKDEGSPLPLVIWHGLGDK